MRYKSFPRVLVPSLGGALAGIALYQTSFVFMPIALLILWEISASLLLSFVWGFIAIAISHSWLLSLHPLTWLGFTTEVSFTITFLIWLSCASLGGLYVASWSYLGKLIKLIFSGKVKDIYQEPTYAFLMSGAWGLGEVYLSHSPLFWIGIGTSLLPGDQWLAGFARLFGAGGLAAIQLIIGWWLWRLIIAYTNKSKWRNTFLKGFFLVLFLHLIGANLLNIQVEEGNKKVAVLQTAIPLRDKFSDKWTSKLPNLIDNSIKLSKERNADLLVTPEGTLNIGQRLKQPTTIPLLSGGFRRVKGEQRSSILLFNPGESTHSSAIDKFRLVPLGEYIPRLPLYINKGLSLVGGIYPGDESRLLELSDSSLAVAICYELSDGNAIAKAISAGGKWILTIANLDPYPLPLRRQFRSLAQLRSIETAKDLVSVTNTGPSVLISSSGDFSQEISSSKEDLTIFEVKTNSFITRYVSWREIPLFIFILINFSLLFFVFN